MLSGKRSASPVGPVATLLALVGLFWLGSPLAWAGQGEDAELRGEFAVTIAEEDVPQDLINGAALVGRWRIAFNPDGTYALERQDVGPLASGRFLVDGRSLTLTDETGLLACPARGGEPSTATYEWERRDGRLALIAITEPCDSRRLLLTTRLLAGFAPCPTEPAVATPPPATPAPVPTGPASPLDVRPALTTPAAGGGTPTAAPQTAAIDELLARMTACWATGDPQKFLPLLSAEHRATLAGDADELRRFALTMGAPIVWERVGEIEPVDAGRVVATVRQTSGDEEDFTRYAFVVEDGAWRWDGNAP